ncbi:15293_t:CDS:2 [Racocetra persica]|uniref:15293_t:CDS:1 n=1 Tax=Racocetra persica TaxID=160502 RepID=A0ACA9LDB1_9GLOM|nr:15293_t:CDS:2 [Racocetra persica]
MQSLYAQDNIFYTRKVTDPIISNIDLYCQTYSRGVILYNQEKLTTDKSTVSSRSMSEPLKKFSLNGMNDPFWSKVHVCRYSNMNFTPKCNFSSSAGLLQRGHRLCLKYAL